MGFDREILSWHILEITQWPGFGIFDFPHHIHSFSHLTKYGIAPTLAVFGAVVEAVLGERSDPRPRATDGRGGKTLPPAESYPARRVSTHGEKSRNEKEKVTLRIQ